MTITDMLGQSGVLTFLGMGTVVGFLAIMVIAISLLGAILGRKSEITDSAKEALQTGTSSPKDTDAHITAAISAAVSEYQKN